MCPDCRADAPRTGLSQPDRPWVWDVLFTEVLSEVQQDDDSDDAGVDLPTPKVGQRSGRRSIAP